MASWAALGKALGEPSEGPRDAAGLVHLCCGERLGLLSRSRDGSGGLNPHLQTPAGREGRGGSQALPVMPRARTRGTNWTTGSSL